MSKEGMTLAEAEKILGMGTLPYDKHRVYNNCGILIECAEENKELDKIPSYLEAKQVGLDDIAEKQLHKTGQFDISSDWKDRCDRCKGVGRMIKLEKREIEVGCHSCGAKGGTKETCPLCHGTKRHVRIFTGLKIDVVCTNCDDKGIAIVKCEDCRGSGQVKKPVNTGKIASSSTCKLCKGAGRKPPKKEKKIWNSSLENKLSQAILDAAEEA